MNDKSSGSLPSLWSDNPFADFRKEMDKVFDGFLRSE